MGNYNRNMSLVDMVLTTATNPGATMHHLLVERPFPPYIVLSIIIQFLTFVAPAIVYQYHGMIEPPSADFSRAMAVSVISGVVFFVLFVTVALRLLGVSTPVIKVFAACVYTPLPFVPILWLYLGLNYLGSGSVTALRYAVTGQRLLSDPFVQYMPFVMKLSLIMSLAVYFQGIKAVGKMSTASGVAVALFTLPLLWGAAVIGLSLSETIWPNTLPQITLFFSKLLVIR